MSPLVRELLVNGLLASAAVRTAKKSSPTALFYMLAGSLVLLATVFFAIAGYAWLLQSYAAPAAASITGAIVLAFAATLGGAGYIAANQKKLEKMARKNPLAERSFVENIEHTLKGVFDNFEEPVKDNPKMALLMAALAGFAAGDQLGERLH